MAAKEAWALAEEQLADLVEWEAALADHVATAYGIHEAGNSLAGPSGLAAESPVEAAAETVRELYGYRQELVELALSWGWNEQGPVCVYLRSRLGWAQRHVAVEDVAEVVGAIHSKVARRVPSRLNRWCPRHPETGTLLEEADSGHLYCPTCKHRFTVEELDAAVVDRIGHSDALLTVRDAASLFGVEAQLIRRAAVKAELDVLDGKVIARQVYKLARQHTSRG